MGLIEEIPKFRANLGQNYKKLKFKEQSEKAGCTIGSLIDFFRGNFKKIKI
jgi:hypothetical protein